MDDWDRWQWMSQLRPMVLGDGLLRLLGPVDRRRILATSAGLKIYADRLSAFGAQIYRTGTYEPDVTDLFRRLVQPGMRVLDIGANEGYFSALAGVLCGPSGHVVAVEPQNALQDIIEINARLNGVTWLTTFNKGFGGDAGERASLNLYPALNTGAASVVNSYRLSWRTQAFEFVSFESLLGAAGGATFDLVKVDVEGFEAEVVRRLLAHVPAGRVTRLLLDYHEAILARRNIDPHSIHESLLRAGMRVEEGDPSRLSSYLLYAFHPATS
jgi:FkbM family methyltransferase